MNSQTAIQNLMNYEVNDTPNQIEVRTDTLEPIQATANKFTFRLDQAGYLDLNSMLVFKHTSATTNNLRVNPWNGALGGIKRAILQVGDHILNDVQDVYKYATMSRINVPPTQRNKFFGHYTGLQWHSKVQNSGTFAEGGTDLEGLAYATQDGGVIGSILVDPIKSGIKKGSATDGTGAAINSYSLGLLPDNNPQYGITLGMLFPALKGQKIPLFLFDKQRILLKVEFNPVAEYMCDITQNDYNNQQVMEPQTAVGLDSVRLIVDYVIMGGEVQNEVMAQTQKQGGYRLEFYDVVNVIKGIDAGNSAQRRDIEHRIGQNGREVHNIFMWKQYPDDVSFRNDYTNLTNNRGAKCLLRGQHCIGVENEEYNCEVNGRDEFTDFKFNPVSQYNELKVALGRPLYVDKPMYCNDENTTNSLLSMVNNGMTGVMKPLAVGLRSGEPALVGGGRMIGNYPIVWKYRYTPISTAVKTGKTANALGTQSGFNVNYFIEVSRIANIRNTPKGMSVIVSY